MRADHLRETALRDLIEAITEEAISLMGENDAAYRMVACALADFLGNGSELAKKLCRPLIDLKT